MTVLGGYGVFGRRIAAALVKHPDAHVRIVGRDPREGRRVAQRLGASFRAADLADRISLRKAIEGSYLVVHTAGPFQGSDHRVARQCLESGSHYIDIADARRFVPGIGALHELASASGLFLTSGASSLPAITHAMVDDLRGEFHSLEKIQMALSPGNQNPRGASTIAAILSYLGQPLRVWQDGRWVERPGWGDACRLEFPPPVGWRRVHNCDVPDLDLFPSRPGVRTVRFRAGLELAIFNSALSLLAWARRHGRLEHLDKRAELLRRLSLLLYPLGSKNGSLAVWLSGVGLDGRPVERNLAIVTDDDGPATPCSPSIVLAKKILDHGPPCTGAFPCVGFVSLLELMDHLRPLGVWSVRGDGEGWDARADSP